MTEVTIRNQRQRIVVTVKRSDARVAEEARLESVYTPKGYPEFESRSLRKFTHLWELMRHALIPIFYIQCNSLCALNV